MSNKKSTGLADPVLSPNLESARAYSSFLNFCVFPIHYKRKAPIVQRGFHDATNNIGQIDDWWSLYPDAGIGLPTGKVNNIVVLDIDPRNNGDLSFDRLIDEYGELPHTVYCMTGGGGSHYYFNYDERINKSTIEGFPGIDIQGDGKYVILPPSTHPNGRTYEWEQSSKPVITPIADMPEWLINLLSKQKVNGGENKRPSSHWVDLFHNTHQGNRNNAVAQMVGHLLRRYVDPLLVTELIYLWNDHKVNPPLNIEEVNTVINSIATKEMERRQQRR